VLRVQATSESDPFFFHSLELGEEDFQSLKASVGPGSRRPRAPRPGLLTRSTRAGVGGAEHPGGLRLLSGAAHRAPPLLRLPRSRRRAEVRPHVHAARRTRRLLRPEPGRRFQAVLRSAGGACAHESTLAVVETNHFKHLTHVALRLRPGNDAAVKQARTLRHAGSSSA